MLRKTLHRKKLRLTTKRKRIRRIKRIHPLEAVIRSSRYKHLMHDVRLKRIFHLSKVPHSKFTDWHRYAQELENTLANLGVGASQR